MNKKKIIDLTYFRLDRDVSLCMSRGGKKKMRRSKLYAKCYMLHLYAEESRGGKKTLRW